MVDPADLIGNTHTHKKKNQFEWAKGGEKAEEVNDGMLVGRAGGRWRGERQPMKESLNQRCV